MIDPCTLSIMKVGLFHVDRSEPEIEAAFARASSAADSSSSMVVGGLWTFADHWTRCGFPRVTIGHRHAAALMATRTAPSAVSSIKAPWPAFAIDVPSGLVEPVLDDGNACSIVHAFVVVLEGKEVFILPGDRNEARVVMAVPSLGKLGSFEGKSPMETAISRLVMGVCMEMIAHRPTRAEGFGVRPIQHKRGAPETWTFRLTRDVKVDCRAAIRDYVRGVTPTTPTVQLLVRGHWKEQSYGPGGKDRRAIFVEPYWRGPEDAPIAVRSLKTGGGDDTG